MFWFGSKDIKKILEPQLQLKSEFFRGLRVLDIPAGSGETSKILLDLGAQVTSADLFPEFFKETRVTCQKVDLQEGLPFNDGAFDVVIFQEGIEHLPDQLKVLREIHRVLVDGGTLLLTTPNFSNLRSRWSYFISESESPRVLPPNEWDSLWKAEGGRIYFGHLFSIGIHRLRTLLKVAGFPAVSLWPSRVNWSSFLIFVPLFPFLAFKHWILVRRTVRKREGALRASDYSEVLRWGLSIEVLCGGHLIVETKKKAEASSSLRPVPDVIQNFTHQT